ncbi:MAG: sugar ABC transporter substrate-binding protein [Flexilinea sp.]
MKTTKAIVLLALIVITICLGAWTTKGESAEKEFVIGFSNMNDIYPYCIKFRDYLVEKANEEGMKVLIADAAGDSNTQNGQIDNFILQGVDVVTAITIDLDASIPAVEAVKAANLPFISYLTNVRDDGGYDSYIYIGSENYDAGLLQGEYLAKALPENAKILYMTGNPNDSQYSARKQGLVDGLKDRPDVTFAAEVAVYNQKDKGITVMEDWLQVYEKIDCVVAQNDDSILGAIEVLKASNRLDGVITVGLDGSDDALASIEAGELTMSVLQDAKGQAEAAIEIFKQIRDGVDPSTIENAYVPFQTITADNVSDFKN